MSKEETPDHTLFTIVHAAIRSYRMKHILDADDESGLQLVDRLTPDEDETVTKGIEEVELLAEEITTAIVASKRETPEKPDFEAMALQAFEEARPGNIAMWTVKPDDEDAIYWREVFKKGAERIWNDYVSSKEEQPINSELLEALKEYHDLFQRMIDNGMVNAAVGSPIRIKAKRVIEKVELKSKGENN